MEPWPEFVTDEAESSPRAIARADLTGWETVVFELRDDPDAAPSPRAPTAQPP